jgi:hypothetical protein
LLRCWRQSITLRNLMEKRKRPELLEFLTVSK